MCAASRAVVVTALSLLTLPKWTHSAFSSLPSNPSIPTRLLLIRDVKTRKSRPEHAKPYTVRSSSIPATASEQDESSVATKTASFALLMSSFDEGLRKSKEAQEFLQYALFKSIASQLVQVQEAVQNSAVNSPCCGPDPETLFALERADQMAGELVNISAGKIDSQTTRFFNDVPCSRQCRVLYVPTALYALRPDSTNTPGKQRQRARADGKKRRDKIVKLAQDLVGAAGFEILAVTLDLDDGSLKQPVGSDDSTKFPKNGKEAFRSWKPHLLYIDGGNTFWLQHCVEKGSWSQDIIDVCSGTTPAVFCGQSAGAILAGANLETAIWKGWDNPSVVPGRETYDDWKGQRGLGLIGSSSFFPHMSDEWDNLVKEKGLSSVYCLQDSEIFCFDRRSHPLYF